MASSSSQFGINNIPYGIASSATRPSPQAVTRIGDDIIFLAELAEGGVFKALSEPLVDIFREDSLNTFAALPKETHKRVRSLIQNAYREKQVVGNCENVTKAQLQLPVHIGDFTDFSASKDHIMNAGDALFGIRALPPAFLKFPPSYAGRCSSIVASGAPVDRPVGQIIEDYTAAEKKIVFSQCRALDYELEVGAVIGRPVEPGQGLKAADADEHIFGLVLVNDWSARDIQGLEMNPLGPFNGKNFATTISPWIITLDALDAHKVPAPPRTEPIAQFLEDPRSANYKINLQVDIIRGDKSLKTCSVGYETMFWTLRQMIAHHTIGGCGLRTGDLVASGTVSGEGDEEHGCLLELTKNGKKPWPLSDGSALTYLLDGDEVCFTGIVGDESDGIGFGECSGVIRPAKGF